MRKGGVFEVIGWITASPNCAVCASEPEVPVNVTVALETDDDELAENVTCWGVPGVIVMVEGEAVTPAGSPVTPTLTCDAKPLEALASSEACAEVPV